MYLDNNASDAAHEFGHHLGLSDRYIDMIALNQTTGDIEGNRFTLPINNIPGDPVNFDANGYNPQNNIMSNPNSGSSISQKQIDVIFSPKAIVETNYNQFGVKAGIERRNDTQGFSINLINGRTMPVLVNTVGEQTRTTLYWINKAGGGGKDNYTKKAKKYFKESTL